ncbi:MAG: shikimate dehydrogenase [Spirochaetota bacterium]
MINARTELYCIFGNPVAHSLSPIIHNAAFFHEGINAVYLAFQPHSPEAAVAAMRTLPILGASITIPFKTEILPFLDVIDPLAEKIGAVNTIAHRNGVLLGYNTDGEGAVSALENSIGDLAGKNVLVLGTGGSARAVSFALLDKGAAVTIAGRMGASQNILADNLSAHFQLIHSVFIGDISAESARRFNIIINTTPLGMKDNDPFPIDPSFLIKEHTVFDIVYRPHRTALLARAEQQGCTIVYGIEMLIRQAAAQFRIWTEKDPPVSVMKNALETVLKEEQA